ncbi:MAG: DUF1653 domain-containing protein [archaeon]
MNKIKINDIYLHYKGNEYQVLNIARHTENNKKLVIYRSLKNNKIWARPYDMFIENIKVDNKIIQRFKLIK